MAEVYVLTFPNGKQYVGRTKKTADVRFRNHVRDSQKSKMPVHRAIRKFGAENVKVAILADGLSWSESAKVEIAWIAKLGTMMPGGYNLTAGGEGRLGCPASEAVRAAVAAANRRRRGKPLSEANRQGIAEATIVSADDVRRALGCEFDPKKEGQVWFVVETAVKALLMRGQNVILDCNSHTVNRQREICRWELR